MVERMLPQDLSKLRIDPVSEPDIEQALASLQACSSAYGQSGRDLYLLQATRFEERLGLLGIDFVPGRTASLIGPRIDSTATLPEQISRGLLGQANCLLQRYKVRLGQVLLDRQQEPESTWYRDCGYEMVIPVDLLARSIEGPRLPKFPQVPGEVQWLVYRSENRDRFLRALTKRSELWANPIETVESEAQRHAAPQCSAAEVDTCSMPNGLVGIKKQSTKRAQAGAGADVGFQGG